MGGPRLVGWNNLEMFTLLSSERQKFHTPVPHGWEYESNRCLGVPTVVMFSYFAHHLCMSVLRFRERSTRIAEVKFDVMKFGASLQTVRHGLISRFAPDDMTRVCGKCVVFIHVVQKIIQKGFEMGIFRLL